MITCSLCSSKFIEGRVCVRCAKTYCPKEFVVKCPFCGDKLISGRIENESFNGILVQWFYIGPSKIGLVDFTEIPSFLPHFLYSSKLDKLTEKIIIFPSKSSSWRFCRVLAEKFGAQWEKYYKKLEKSRYTILFDASMKERYILLNLEATPQESVEFLLRYLHLFFSYAESFRKIDNSIVYRTLAETLFNYVNKLGIPFVKVDDHTLSIIRLLPDDLLQAYAEYMALKTMVKNDLSNVSELVKHKVDLLLQGIDFRFIDSLPAVFDILKTYVRLSSFLVLGKEDPILEQYIMNMLSIKDKKIKQKLKNFPDVLKSIKTLKESLSKREVYSSYEKFLHSVTESMKEAFEILKPRYLRMSEATALFRINEEYKRRIESGEVTYLPRLGSLRNYIQLLTNIFKNEELFPELRIVAGQNLLDLLEFRYWKEGDLLAFYEGIEIVKELAKLIVESMPKIRTRFGKIKGIKGYLDACLNLMVYSQFCLMANETKIAYELLRMSKK